MSDALTIARPYARAVYERALETGTVEDWQQFLQLAGSIYGREDVAMRMGIPGFTQSVSAWLNELLKQSRGEGLKKEEKNFMALLDEFDRFSFAPEINQVFSEMRREEQQKLFAEIQSAEPLSDEQVTEIVDSLSKRFGKEVESRVEVDPSLLAGLRIKIDNQVIDNTAEGRLQRFARLLDI